MYCVLPEDIYFFITMWTRGNTWNNPYFAALLLYIKLYVNYLQAIRALQTSKLSAIVVDVAVSRLSSSPSGHVTVRYDVSLLRSYVPDSVVVTTDIREAFRHKLVTQENETTILEDTSIPISSAHVKAMEVRGKEWGP